MQVELRVNGVPTAADVEPRLLLVHYLRHTLGLTGTHVGCDTSSCGACTVILDGAPVKSCTVLAVQAADGAVTTVEGLASTEGLSSVQEGFRQKHGLQCGYCTPGMLCAATALLDENPTANREEIRRALKGNLCRCTGYSMIVDAVSWAAEHRTEGDDRVTLPGGEVAAASPAPLTRETPEFRPQAAAEPPEVAPLPPTGGSS